MTRRELVALFRALRAQFRGRAGTAGLVLEDRYSSPGSKGRVRDVAWVDLDTRIIHLCKRALKFPAARIEGLLIHEFGHLADPTPNRRGAEKRADRLGGRTTRRTIRYDEADIQTTGRGRLPRPPYLHQ